MAAVSVLLALVSLIAAATHPWPERLMMVQGVLILVSTGHNLGRGVSVACSIGLLLVARGLARRQRRAWLAAVLLACASVFAAVRGSELGLAVFAAIVACALLAGGGQFYARTEASKPLSILRVCATTVAALYSYGLAAIYWHAAARHQAIAATAALTRVTWGLVGQDGPAPVTRFSHGLTVTLAVAALGTAVILIWWLLRAPVSGVTGDARDRATAQRLVQQAGCDSLAYFALRHDKRYFINSRRSAFLAYRAVGGIALVSGDPIGARADFEQLLADFARHCRRHAWRVAVIGVAPENRSLWQTLGLKTVAVGDEAIVETARFSLEGRAIRKVRQSVHRLERLGYRVEILAADAVTEKQWQGIDRVSVAWGGGLPERGFSMALDEMRGPDRGDCLFVLGLASGGELAGFLHFAPVPATGDLSLAAMRRLPDAPNGLTEWLVCSVVGWGREHRVSRISLNFAAFGGLLRATELPPAARLARRGLRYADRFFQLERLLQFNAKFNPEWLPRYLAVERYSDVPAAGIVLLTLERLVRWPRPVVRLWLRP